MKHIVKKMFQVSCSMLHEIGRSRSRSFFFFTACFLAGVAIHSIFLDLPLSAISIGLFLLFPAVFYFWGAPSRLPLLAAAIIFLGMLRFALALEPLGNQLLSWKNKNIFLQGTVTKSVRGTKSSVITFRGEVLQAAGERRVINEPIIIFLPRFQEYGAGERLELWCVLKERKDWPRSAPRWMCLGESVRPLGAGDLGAVGNVVAKTQAKFLQGLNSAFPEPQSSLARGLILGNDFGFSGQLFRSFVVTGTAHIVAVSGWNVTMVTSAVFLALIFLGVRKTRAFLATLFFIVFYCLLSGAGSSVIRAGLMGSLSGLAWQVRRPYRVKNAIAAAALLMVIFNPRVLVFDLGFLLSFAATAGLVFLFPKFKSFLPKKINIHILKWSAETLAQTVSAMIFTLPIILIAFGNLSLISPLANLLILPAVPLATIMSFAAAAAGMASPAAGQAVGMLAWIPLTYIIGAAELLAKIPFAGIAIQSFWAKILVLGLPASVFLFRALSKRRIKEPEDYWKISEI